SIDDLCCQPAEVGGVTADEVATSPQWRDAGCKPRGGQVGPGEADRALAEQESSCQTQRSGWNCAVRRPIAVASHRDLGVPDPGPPPAQEEEVAAQPEILSRPVAVELQW